MELLHEYEFEIVYRPGKENVVADTLSRKSFLGGISMPSNPILQEVRNISPMDPEYQRMKRIVEQGPSNDTERTSVLNYSINDDCLYYRYRLCVPKDSSLRRRLYLRDTIVYLRDILVM